ncbi:hypothetical protein LEP1GSC125_0551 [Leptospira mayottensis 200901122]|uniref:Uncharacterized protein n=1 Tax=Leptospira mayottensis 200901122 TaxID=1193010 RepID=A0AA87SYK6_9LEPT|nr:hypothetical protein LEP1GSC125_0551 [Leptospira mayottensis 200901122]
MEIVFQCENRSIYIIFSIIFKGFDSGLENLFFGEVQDKNFLILIELFLSTVFFKECKRALGLFFFDQGIFE